MDEQIDARFERLEKALTTLVDSITKYNPSVNAASELVNAEENLSRGLEQVEIHQNNHLRLQQLRFATAALDSQIRDVLVSLDTTRKDLTSTPATTFPSNEHSYSFSYGELLSYARLISKTSVPFMGASLEGMGLDNQGNPLPNPEEQQAAQDSGAASTAQSGQQQQQAGATAANGGASQLPGTQPQSQSQATLAPTASGAAPTPNSTSTPLTTHPQQPSPAPAPVGGTTTTFLNPALGSAAPSNNPLTSLPDFLHRKANPRLDDLFYPFPDQNKILSGCLVANQLLAESGIDPKNHDPAAEAERAAREEEERAAQAEKERQAREEENRRIRQEREAEANRRRREHEARARQQQEQLQRQEEEERRRRLSAQGAAQGQGQQGQPAGAGGSAISPTTEKIGRKGEFKFMADDDDDD